MNIFITYFKILCHKNPHFLMQYCNSDIKQRGKGREDRKENRQKRGEGEEEIQRREGEDTERRVF